MRIVVAGGTGFLGRPLAAALAENGHDVTILSRQDAGVRVDRGKRLPPARAQARMEHWTPDGTAGDWARVVDGADAVVNLAGESIAGGRWTAARKQRILDSRVLATQSLVQAIARAAHPPAVFVSGSAVGYYGPCGDDPITEEAPAGTDFLATVCAAWEREASEASSHTRVVTVRTGLVLERDGGALPKMLPPFWFGAGGPVGSGRQYWPWIHRRDWIDLVRWAIATPAVSGPTNATAPAPVPNAEFAKALGRAIHRPAIVPTPGFALKLLLGEMAEGLLLSGQRAIPDKALRLGFTFAYPDLFSALQATF